MDLNPEVLIFDLGNVIIDVDYQPTIDALQKHTNRNVQQLLSYSRQVALFDEFERGNVTVPEFLNGIRDLLANEQLADEVIVDAWNRMLVHYPVEKIEMLNDLKTKYRVIALSNINDLHVQAIDRVASIRFGVPHFESLFHKAYYSNRMGCRKPEDAIFQKLKAEESMLPERMLFIDDKQENVAAAIRNGIPATVLHHSNELLDFLKKRGIA